MFSSRMLPGLVEQCVSSGRERIWVIKLSHPSHFQLIDSGSPIIRLRIRFQVSILVFFFPPFLLPALLKSCKTVSTSIWAHVSVFKFSTGCRSSFKQQLMRCGCLMGVVLYFSLYLYFCCFLLERTRFFLDKYYNLHKLALLSCIISSSSGQNRSYIPLHHLLSQCRGVGGKYFNIALCAEYQGITDILKSWYQTFLTDVNWPLSIGVILKNIRSIV